MTVRGATVRWCAALLAAAACGVPAARAGADVVELRGSGGRLEGEVVKAGAAGIEVRSRRAGLEQSQTVPWSDVRHVESEHLPADAPLGEPFAKVLGLDDPVIDVAITPNRQDCLGVRGIARDLAAIAGTGVSGQPLGILSAVTNNIPTDGKMDI